MNSMHSIVKDDLEFILSSQVSWESFFGKTVLVSGANGLLPSYIVDTLLYLNSKKRGDPIKVVGIVRSLDKAKNRFSWHRDTNDLVLIGQDVCEPIMYNEKVDFIIHAASQASPKYYGVDPVGTLNANVIGTKNLLDLALKNAVNSFLLFSSGEVYGQVSNNVVSISETDYGYVDPTNVRSCYAESKRLAETMCVSWSHQFGIPVKIVRPFHTYGPMMRSDDGRVFADFVFDVVNDRNIVMKSDGSAKRVFCYIADATIGFFLILLNGSDRNAYNLAGSENVSIAALAEMLVNLFPEKKLHVAYEKRSESNDYLESPLKFHFPNTAKLQSLGWSTKYNIEDGFYRTVRSYM